MEGRHFALGPWFTVQPDGATKTLGSLFLSDGARSQRAHLELRLELTSPEKPTHTRKLASAPSERSETR